MGGGVSHRALTGLIVMLWFVRSGQEEETFPNSGHFTMVTASCIRANKIIPAEVTKRKEWHGNDLHTQRHYNRHRTAFWVQYHRF